MKVIVSLFLALSLCTSLYINCHIEKSKKLTESIAYQDSMINALNEKINALEYKKNAQMLYLINTINDKKALGILVDKLNEDCNNYNN